MLRKTAPLGIRSNGTTSLGIRLAEPAQQYRGLSHYSFGFVRTTRFRSHHKVPFAQQGFWSAARDTDLWKECLIYRILRVQILIKYERG